MLYQLLVVFFLSWCWDSVAAAVWMDERFIILTSSLL